MGIYQHISWYRPVVVVAKFDRRLQAKLVAAVPETTDSLD